MACHDQVAALTVPCLERTRGRANEIYADNGRAIRRKRQADRRIATATEGIPVRRQQPLKPAAKQGDVLAGHRLVAVIAPQDMVVFVKNERPIIGMAVVGNGAPGIVEPFFVESGFIGFRGRIIPDGIVGEHGRNGIDGGVDGRLNRFRRAVRIDFVGARSDDRQRGIQQRHDSDQQTDSGDKNQCKQGPCFKSTHPMQQLLHIAHPLLRRTTYSQSVNFLLTGGSPLLRPYPAFNTSPSGAPRCNRSGRGWPSGMNSIATELRQ